MQPEDLRAARKQMGLSQAELAAALGLTTPFISMMERGIKKVEARTRLAVLYLVEHPEARAQ